MKESPMRLLEKLSKKTNSYQFAIPVYQRNYTWKKHKRDEEKGVKSYEC